jgi:hypothetical protein
VVDRLYLLDYLKRKKLVWTALGETFLTGNHSGSAPRLEFHRAHLLDREDHLRSSELLWKAD